MIEHRHQHHTLAVHICSQCTYCNNKLTDEEWSTAFSMANFVFAPQIFNAPPSGSINRPRLSRKEFTWVCEDTVVCITTHLDDEGNLQASMSRLIDAILEQKDNPGDYFEIWSCLFRLPLCSRQGYQRRTYNDTQSYGCPPIFTVTPRRFSFDARDHCSCSPWLSYRPSTPCARYEGQRFVGTAAARGEKKWQAAYRS
ncbi:hypothetical protein K503DRAFT_286815 [Rhizopogon vinicolor AM-OR11-026]|uniref:Uncharacterized protein n=1 Tax=Rhizopogon vinicolor AM-OR11-026 TaxID=1314800 RepID=A0A1B7MVL3_9AGAM|nr:hypothetical protein K503DRAFT_286815 [Rhizopogon vinicolor AM-OR11-026]